MRHPLDKITIYEYALEGISLIRSCSIDPSDPSADEIFEELDAHEANLKRRIAAHARGLAQHDDPEREACPVITLRDIG